ncbi:MULTISPECIES: LysR family transcriptional regulator [Hafnia]|uniref:LysR family transcriptional regulator n=1 Tax=Hafnia TaxID=568 RepID=UPI00076B7439|nr:LysR family transcriptional regulator [Hafnia paralvei]AMH20237.1 LysR family transcriptional regulator [Hafnia paralvei]MCK2181562.1 LysR family transcriptional regulator [Hafnia paralvei]MDX6839890.1 LysR family transcriptional regulator [Hafnia paralvei]NIH31775.1 LysR family transcriptional regulator [Hafnia paralvei]RDA69132.1 LysR family transcriptional regulator [Hafnia paralvei]
MDKISAMQVFVSVAELSSFSRTAERLGLPKGSVSGAIQQLENQFGTQLLHRTTRKVTLTQDGHRCYERCKGLLADIDELESLFRTSSAPLSGRLRVDMPSGLAKIVIQQSLAEFLTAHPELELELSSSDRRVDLIQEGFDCVVRVGALQDSGLIARPLGKLQMVNCASPAYLQKYGCPQNATDLQSHQMVHYQNAQVGHSDRFEYVTAQGDVQQVEMQGALTVNSTESYSAACIAGLGIIQVPIIGVRHALDTGTLVAILPQLSPPAMPVSLLYPHRRNLARRVQVFMDWMSDIIRQQYVQ